MKPVESGKEGGSAKRIGGETLLEDAVSEEGAGFAYPVVC